MGPVFNACERICERDTIIMWLMCSALTIYRYYTGGGGYGGGCHLLPWQHVSTRFSSCLCWATDTALQRMPSVDVRPSTATAPPQFLANDRQLRNSSRTGLDLTGIFDWPGSDVTGIFDWGRGQT